MFNFIWMTVFGNSAIWFDLNVANGALSNLAKNPDALMFRFLEYLPFSTIASFMTIVIVIIFFVTSADSGIFVMNSIATKNAPKSPKWQTALWGLLLAVLALLLLNAGGLKALQSMTLITALPFSIIMILFIISLIKALSIDQSYYDRTFSKTTIPWSGNLWKDRLKQIVGTKDRSSVDYFIGSVVKEAFTELQAEFAENGIVANINFKENPAKIEIEIKYNIVNNFVYGVETTAKKVSNFLVDEVNLPDVQQEGAYFPKAYFGDTRESYDIQYFTKNELISDVLKHYDRFLDISSEQKNEMFTSSDFNTQD